LGLFTWGIKQLGHVSDRSPPSGAEVMIKWNVTSTPPYAFVVCTES